MEEREHRTNHVTPRQRQTQADHSGSNQTTTTSTERTQANTDRDTNRQTNTGGNGELELKNVKCFGCHKKGHVVSECPDKKKRESARMIHANGATCLPNTEETATDP